MIQRILLPTDGSSHANRAAAFAGDIAEKYGAEVVVLHVIDRANLDEGDERMAEVEHVASRERDTLPWVANVPAELAAMLTPQASTQTQDKMLGYLGDRVVRAATRELEAHGVRGDRIRVVFKNGHAVKRILETVDEEKPDLVVTGSRGVSDFAGAVQGSVSHRVSHLAACSVITVK